MSTIQLVFVELRPFNTQNRVIILLIVLEQKVIHNNTGQRLFQYISVKLHLRV